MNGSQMLYSLEQGRGAVGGGGGRKRSMHFAHFEILHIVYREVLLLCYCYYCQRRGPSCPNLCALFILSDAVLSVGHTCIQFAGSC